MDRHVGKFLLVAWLLSVKTASDRHMLYVTVNDIYDVTTKSQ